MLTSTIEGVYIGRNDWKSKDGAEVSRRVQIGFGPMHTENFRVSDDMQLPDNLQPNKACKVTVRWEIARNAPSGLFRPVLTNLTQ